MSCQEAKNLYEEYRAHGTDGWGPWPFSLHNEALTDIERRIDQFMKRADIKYLDLQTVLLPSPWHAYLFILQHERHWKHSRNPSHQLYRGQADVNWSIESTLSRTPECDRVRAITENCLFSMILLRRLQFPGINEAAYAGIARHLGFKSSLVDWTVDPAVAICFACNDHHDRLGVVYVTQFRDAVEQNMLSTLPPICCDRLYKQYGVFIQTAVEEKMSSTRFLKVVFEKCASVSEFVCVRDGARVDMMKCHPWLTQTADWVIDICRRAPSSSVDKSWILKNVEEVLKQIPRPPAEMLVQDMREQLMWGYRVVDLYHWMFIYLSLDRQSRLIDLKVAARVISENKAISALAGEALKLACAKRPTLNMENVADVLIKYSDVK